MGWELVQKPPTRKGAEKLDCHPARRGPAAFGCQRRSSQSSVLYSHLGSVLNP